MYKKFTIAAIMIILGSMIFSPIVSSSEQTTTDKNDSFGLVSIFASSAIIDMNYTSIDEEVIPNSTPIDIELNLTYQLSGAFSWWHYLVFKNKAIPISLLITEKPEWCSANIEISELQKQLSSAEPINSSLSVSVNEKAPAFTQGIIKVQAVAPAIKGLLGIVTKVEKANYTFDVKFVIGYLPAMTVEIDEDLTYQEIPPLNTTTIPINITNLGNGPTMFTVELITNESATFASNIDSSVTLASPISGEKNKEEIQLSISPYKNFSIETLKVKITPSLVGRPDLTGVPEIVTITLKNDGSLKEEEESEINSILLLVVIVVIILVLIFAIILKKRK